MSFPWCGAAPETGPMRALEWFTVRGGKVIEIRIHLWDTVAVLATLQAMSDTSEAHT